MTASIIACFDDDAHADSAVGDHAAWAARRLGAPLCLLHVLEHAGSGAQGDLSGQIGLGAREQLLDDLTEEDARQARRAREQGRAMLQALSERLSSRVDEISTLQRHGEVESTLAELCRDNMLLVVGRCGRRHALGEDRRPLGEHLESLAHTVTSPLMIAPDEYHEPQRVLIAFDGSARALRQVEWLIECGWLKGLECHVVQVGESASANTPETAVERLSAAGLSGRAVTLEGEARQQLPSYAREQQIDFTVMRAYGHSSLRRWLSGSTTHHLLEHMPGALLLLRSRG
ncbi:nucleotide-binding universal stress UspA family protein [Kushneria sinocarnis]|uniref:Nucleotide-binding universal stress UspA family protein n=1 Tax=Kushneria sinocarnis TaxID=595502 RepID=A0A420WXF9_9GAMM|nr:universal stress protein [Kushneria sinocarnis]RKR04352.1 nucleotide-binding universal stress UspA family protein [Kushneria sinocarnis]